MKQTNQNLTPLAIKDFAKKVISDGHLYLRSGESRNFYVMKPGVLIEPAFIKKHAATQTVFGYDPVTNPEVIQKFAAIFKEWKYLQFEKDFRAKGREIVGLFKELYSEENNFLSFALACFHEFNTVPHERLLKMHEADLHLFQKAFYSGAFAVLIALSNDFYHYPMVKDFFNLTLTLDIGLCGPSYTYFVAEACNRENQAPGSALSWIQKAGATEQEVKLFLEHPDRGYAFLKGNEDLLSYPELAEVTLYQHELASGNGFPRGIAKAQISSWEAVVILADSMVEIKDEHSFETDVMGFLKLFKNSKLNDLPVNRVFLKLCAALDLPIHTEEAAG